MHSFFVLLILVFTITLSTNGALAQTDSSGRAAKTFSRTYGRTGVFVDTGIYLGQSDAVANPATSNEWQHSTSIYDFKAGYITDSKLYFGAEYSSRTDDLVTADSADGKSAGLGLGLFSDAGFNARAFYVFDSTFGNYGSGTGYKVDLGYMINLTANFFLGFSVSMRQTTFKSNNSIFQFSSWARRETYPLVSLGIIFN